MNGVITTPSHTSPSKIERLIPLKFEKRFSNIINGILTEDEQPPTAHHHDPTFVEHYLDISVDREINKDLLCRSGVKPDARKCGGMSSTHLDCEDTVMVGKIYKPTSKGPYGEDC